MSIRVSTGLIIGSGRWGIVQRRFQSNIALDKVPIRLIAIPITSKKCFIYCKHNTISLVPSDNSILDKVINKATETWNKFENSKSKVNVKIVEGLKKVMARIPTDEGSLKSIPSLNAIMRELSDADSDHPHKEYVVQKDDKSLIRQKDIITHKMDIDLIRIPIYYPSSITSEQSIAQQLSSYATNGYRNHLQKFWWSILALPLTVPFIILPVVPNIPGFYLCYRAYCHFTAMNGAKHLRYLLQDNHLEYTKLDHNSLQLYKSTTDEAVLNNLELFLKGEDSAENIILGDDVVEKICHSFHCDDLSNELKLALKQEKSKLSINK